jgi:hypothetical protein
MLLKKDFEGAIPVERQKLWIFTGPDTLRPSGGSVEWIGGRRRHSMPRCRLAAGGLALLPALVVTASAQNCPLPWTCQDSQPFAESVEPKAADARRTQNVKNNLPSRKGSPRTARPDLRRLAAAGSHQRLAMRHLSQRDNDEERKEPLLKELRRQESQSTTPADQIARDVP